MHNAFGARPKRPSIVGYGRNCFEKKLQIICCVLCAVMLLFSVCIAYQAKAEANKQWFTIQYANENVTFQPVPMQANDQIDTKNPGLYFDDEGYVSPELMRQVSPILTGHHEMITMDVSEERILLQLAQDGQIFLRIAQWECELNDYALIDTGLLPSERELDTYHDGDAVLITIPYMESAAEKSNEPQENAQLFLTFQQLENGWYLTNFTDGQTFIAKLRDQAYLFSDYYESDPAYEWTVQEALAFENFSTSDLRRCIESYHTARPNQPPKLE